MGFMGDYFTAASIAFPTVSPRKSSPVAGWKNLAAMLFSELVTEVESDTFAEQRYVVCWRVRTDSLSSG